MDYTPLIDFWLDNLSISDWSVSTNCIENENIDYNDQDYFIGIERDFKNKIAIIYYDIPLTDVDICHELLHIKYPEWKFPELSFSEYEDIIDGMSIKIVSELYSQIEEYTSS